MTIHPTAIVSEGARIGEGVTIGPFAVVESDVAIGEGCYIASHVVIKQFTTIGKRNRIAEHAVIGGLPQDVSFKGDKSFLTIGDDNLIREFATIHRGSSEGKETGIGSRNFIMVGVHLAHDCIVGDDNIFANGVALAGHIQVEDHVFFSSNVGAHQFVRFGRYAMVGGKSKIVQDVLPFFTTDGNPPYVHGLNVVGLRRAGFTTEEKNNLKQAYRLLLRSSLLLEDALNEMAEMNDDNVNHLIGFIRGSKRGFIRAQKKHKTDANQG
jgi:UDP-N-acetylglucosamine acyltransferase